MVSFFFSSLTSDTEILFAFTKFCKQILILNVYFFVFVFSDGNQGPYGPQCIGLNVRQSNQNSGFNTVRLEPLNKNPNNANSCHYLPGNSILQTHTPTPSEISSIHSSPRENLPSHSSTMCFASVDQSNGSSMQNIVPNNNNPNDKSSFLEPSPCRIDGNKKLLSNSLSGHDLPDTNFLSGNDSHPLHFDTSKSLSPYCLPENPPTPFSFSNSPRHSANMSSRLSGKTTSPLCIDGVELTTLIRVSPSSLSSSRISSASFSPQYIGHLSARSCGTPNSGSGSSGSRNFSYMSQGTISNMKREIDFHTGANNLESYLLPSNDSKDPFMRNQLVIPHDQVPFVEQMYNSQHMAFLESEQSALAFPDSSVTVSSTATVNNNNSNPNHNNTSGISANNTNNNTVTNTNNNINANTPLVSSAPGSIVVAQTNPNTNTGLHIRPPPSYAQALQEQKMKQQTGLPYVAAPCLQSPLSVKTEPFEDGEKRQVCKWIDCNLLFDEQDELVRHIEKVHIDQRKAEDFTCFWQGCLRRLKPFNARYKLLIHMRVHSGEKPNKCTVSIFLCRVVSFYFEFFIPWSLAKNTVNICSGYKIALESLIEYKKTKVQGMLKK